MSSGDSSPPVKSSSEAFTPARVLRPREQVEVQIQQAILSGELKQGDKLPSETALASQFAVSRTTVREALRGLATTGLISKVPGMGGGSFVKSVDHRALGSVLADSLENTLRLGSITSAELQVLRRLLELPAASLAAQYRTDAQLAFLHSVVDREKNTTVDDPVVSELDISFHSAVAETSRNRPLAAFVSALHHVARPVGFIKLSAEVGRQTVRQHQEVVRMIEKQDPEGAAEAMAAHLDYLAAQGVERANATSEPVSVKRPPWSDVSSPELSRVWPPTPPA